MQIRTMIGVLALTLAFPLCGEPVRAKQYEMSQRFSHPGMKIRSNKLANWYVLGEEVVFSSETKLPETDRVRVVMTDADGSVYLDRTLSAKEFNRNGWRWKSDEPGYYEVRFERKGQINGVIGEKWTIPIWRLSPQNNRYEEVSRKTYERTVHSVVVTPEKTRKPGEISPQFSLSDGLHEKSIRFAALVGFHGIRVHTVDWEAIEPERGKFNWIRLDAAMKIAREYGFHDAFCVFNVFGVPRWASSNPQGNRIALGSLKNYKTVIPENLSDWQNFLVRLMRRYPDVRNFELWNEPHFPGYSVFWSDTPENHVKLIAAGYEAIKKENPAAVVWWAGLSRRYAEFYRRFLALGGGKYFDVLSIHGTWQNYSLFSGIEREAGIAVKPKVNSEWHANLIKPFQAYYPTEIQGVRKVMLGFLDMIRQGVPQVYFFTLFNSGGCELDELAENRKAGRHDPNVSGLFRVRTYTQPRYMAAAWHVLTAFVRGTLKVHDGYSWNRNGKECAAVLVSSDAGPMLLFWGLGAESTALPPELRKAVAGAQVVRPDGRPVAEPGNMRLAPDYYYIARGFDFAEVRSWTNKAQVLKPDEVLRPLNQEVRGVYRPAPLFDSSMEPVNAESMRFHPFRKELSCFKGARTGRVTAEFAMGLDGTGMDLLVRVKDPVHRAGTKVTDFWTADSVQIAFDTQGKGRSADTLEFGASWTESGGARLWKTLSPHLDGDLPDRYTAPNLPELKYGRLKVLRRNGMTEYRIHVEPTELYPFVYRKGDRPRLALLVNNDDGKGRESYLEWGSGIGTVKDSALHGTLTVQLPEKVLMRQQDLTRKSGTCSLHTSDGVVQVKTADTAMAGVSTAAKTVSGGAECEVSFEARGNAPLILMVTGKGFKRIDPLKSWRPLTPEWQVFRCRLDFPPEAENFSCTFFFWKQKEKWFEIRNFRVSSR